MELAEFLILCDVVLVFWFIASVVVCEILELRGADELQDSMQLVGCYRAFKFGAALLELAPWQWHSCSFLQFFEITEKCCLYLNEKKSSITFVCMLLQCGSS